MLRPRAPEPPMRQLPIYAGEGHIAFLAIPRTLEPYSTGKRPIPLQARKGLPNTIPTRITLPFFKRDERCLYTPLDKARVPLRHDDKALDGENTLLFPLFSMDGTFLHHAKRRTHPFARNKPLLRRRARPPRHVGSELPLYYRKQRALVTTDQGVLDRWNLFAGNGVAIPQQARRRHLPPPASARLRRGTP